MERAAVWLLAEASGMRQPPFPFTCTHGNPLSSVSDPKPDGSELAPDFMQWLTAQDLNRLPELAASKNKTVSGLLPTPNTFDAQAPKSRARRWWHRYVQKHGTDSNLREVVLYDYGLLEELHVEECGEFREEPAPEPVHCGQLSIEFAMWMMCIPEYVRAEIRQLPRAQAFLLAGNGVNPVQEGFALAELRKRVSEISPFRLL